MLMVYDTTLDEEGHIARMADVVDGVGEATAERVVNHFDSTVELFEADLDEIAEIKGIGESRAKEILSYTSPLNEELNKNTE
jgi:ERCC4-type nuclease